MAGLRYGRYELVMCPSLKSAVCRCVTDTVDESSDWMDGSNGAVR